jgi:hypothetical protein
VRALRELTHAQIDAFIGALGGVSHVVQGAYAVDLVSRDPDDNPVVACDRKRIFQGVVLVEEHGGDGESLNRRHSKLVDKSTT